MSTLASLAGMLGDTQIRPWSEGMQSVNRAQLGGQEVQTGLIKLAQLKQSQASEAEVMAAIQRDPSLQALFFGGGMPQSILGSLQTAPAPGGPPAAGPLTQQTFGAGQPPGAPTVVPGGQDLSQFAQQGGPPQSTIASLGQPQPQGPMPGPQNPLLEMARRDPRAAMMLQQQMQAQQDRQWKMQEQQLGMGVKVAEFVARELQGVTDQASLDQARERVRQVHPQAAAQMPQMYSKEGIETVQQRGIAISDMALWKLNMAKARKANVEAEILPKLLEQEGVGGTTPAGGTSPTAGAPPAAGRSSGGGGPPSESEATRLIRAEAIRQDVDPDLAVAVATQESYLNPNAEGDGGKAKGYFQLHEGAAKDAKIDPARRHEPALNIQGGVAYLKLKLAQSKGDVDEALKLYNGGGDPNYVANVRRFLPGAGAGAGRTGTSQAPPEDPRVSGLRAQIKQGQAKAKQYALLGYESMATQYSKDVDDLQKEVDRLEAPRQEFLKKQAVQGLELEQREREGLARAQLEADTKPASNAEIDAINRALPRDKQLSYGTTYKEIREKKLVGAAPVSDKVVTDLTTTTTAIQNFEELSNAVTALPTGPLTQYVEQFKERWGIDISDEKVAQRAILAGARNQLLQARSGAAVPESEYQRLLSELPHEGNDPKVFKARLANTVRQFKNLYKTRVQILRKTGHAIPDDLMEPLAAPEAPPAPKVSTAVDKARDIMKPR